MKKLTCALLLALAVGSLIAQENLILNGGIENIHKQAKGTDKYLLRQIRNGWDLGKKPFVTLPQGWTLNNGKGKLQIITVGPDGQNKENVHSGKHSAYLEAQGGHIQLPCKTIYPGNYELSFWYKGKGQITFCAYNYGLNPLSGKNNRFLVTLLITTIHADSPDEWKQHKQVITLGQKNPEIKECCMALCGAKGNYYLDDLQLIPVKKSAN